METFDAYKNKIELELDAFFAKLETLPMLNEKALIFHREYSFLVDDKNIFMINKHFIDKFS